MRKTTFILFIALFTALSAVAQPSNILERIKTTNSSVKSLETDVHEKYVKNDRVSTQDGKLYYLPDNNFAAYFEAGDHIVIDENRLKIDLGILHGKFKRSNGAMNTLCKVFLYGFQGRCQDLANESNYSIKTETVAKDYKVTFTTRKKRLIGMGFKQVIFVYGQHNLLLKEITLVSYNGSIDTYTISNMNYNVAINNSKFKM